MESAIARTKEMRTFHTPLSVILFKWILIPFVRIRFGFKRIGFGNCLGGRFYGSARGSFDRLRIGRRSRLAGVQIHKECNDEQSYRSREQWRHFEARSTLHSPYDTNQISEQLEISTVWIGRGVSSVTKSGSIRPSIYGERSRTTLGGASRPPRPACGN